MRGPGHRRGCASSSSPPNGSGRLAAQGREGRRPGAAVGATLLQQLGLVSGELFVRHGTGVVQACQLRDLIGGAGDVGHRRSFVKARHAFGREEWLQLPPDGGTGLAGYLIGGHVAVFELDGQLRSKCLTRPRRARRVGADGPARRRTEDQVGPTRTKVLLLGLLQLRRRWSCSVCRVAVDPSKLDRLPERGRGHGDPTAGRRRGAALGQPGGVHPVDVLRRQVGDEHVAEPRTEPVVNDPPLLRDGPGRATAGRFLIQVSVEQSAHRSVPLHPCRGLADQFTEPADAQRSAFPGTSVPSLAFGAVVGHEPHRQTAGARFMLLLP